MSNVAKIMTSLSEGLQNALQRLSCELHRYSFPAADRGILMCRAGITPGVATATAAPQQIAQPVTLAAAQPLANKPAAAPVSVSSQQPAAAKPIQVASKDSYNLRGKALWGS